MVNCNNLQQYFQNNNLLGKTIGKIYEKYPEHQFAKKFFRATICEWKIYKLKKNYQEDKCGIPVVEVQPLKNKEIPSARSSNENGGTSHGAAK